MPPKPARGWLQGADCGMQAAVGLARCRRAGREDRVPLRADSDHGRPYPMPQSLFMGSPTGIAPPPLDQNQAGSQPRSSSWARSRWLAPDQGGAGLGGQSSPSQGAARTHHRGASSAGRTPRAPRSQAHGSQPKSGITCHPARVSGGGVPASPSASLAHRPQPAVQRQGPTRPRQPVGTPAAPPPATPRVSMKVELIAGRGGFP